MKDSERTSNVTLEWIRGEEDLQCGLYGGLSIYSPNGAWAVPPPWSPLDLYDTISILDDLSVPACTMHEQPLRLEMQDQTALSRAKTSLLGKSEKLIRRAKSELAGVIASLA